jgi:hypothetical protein
VTTEPLHVRTARALGWTDIQNLGPRQYGPKWHTPGADLWVGHPPTDDSPMIRDLLCKVGGIQYEPIPPYGEESAEGTALCGELIAVIVATEGRVSVAREHVDGAPRMIAVCGWWSRAAAPQEAVQTALAELLCALHEAGRLPR